MNIYPEFMAPPMGYKATGECRPPLKGEDFEGQPSGDVLKCIDGESYGTYNGNRWILVPTGIQIDFPVKADAPKDFEHLHQCRRPRDGEWFMNKGGRDALIMQPGHPQTGSPNGEFDHKRWILVPSAQCQEPTPKAAESVSTTRSTVEVQHREETTMKLFRIQLVRAQLVNQDGINKEKVTVLTEPSTILAASEYGACVAAGAANASKLKDIPSQEVKAIVEIPPTAI